jgi:hypothetical protein
MDRGARIPAGEPGQVSGLRVAPRVDHVRAAGVGPAGNFSGLLAAAKGVLSFAMFLGRLELFTLLVLIRPGS